jgi:hypothetical protein
MEVEDAAIPAQAPGDANAKADNVMKTVLKNILYEDGQYKFICFIEDSLGDSDPSGDDTIEMEGDMHGGMPPPRMDQEAQRKRDKARQDKRVEAALAAASAARAAEADKKRRPAPSYDPAKENYASYVDDATKKILLGTVDPAIDYNVVETILLFLEEAKFPALLGLSRNQWEIPKPPGQCSAAGKGANLPCWLCGNPVGMGQGGAVIGGKRMSVCGRTDNQYECEHVLPGVFMLFLKMLINKTRTGAVDPNVRLLYDSSCHICNTVKSDGLYIKARWIEDGKLEFKPDSEKILVDVLTFILSTRVGETTEITRVDQDDDLPAYPGLPKNEGDKKAIGKKVEDATKSQQAQLIRSAGQFIPYADEKTDDKHLRERNREIAKGVVVRELATKILNPADTDLNRSNSDPATETDWPSPRDQAPICSGRPAVHYYYSKSSGNEVVVERSTITSITVAAPLIPAADKPEVVALNAAVTAYLSYIGAPPGAIPSPGIERTAAFSVSPRFNNLTRAVIEQIDTANPPPPPLPASTTALGELDLPKFEYLLRGKPAVRNLAWSTVTRYPVPADAAASTGPSTRSVTQGLDFADETIVTSAARLASLMSAGVPLKVDPARADIWIRDRFSKIFDRMTEVCAMLNAEPKIVDYVKSLANEPILTQKDFVSLGAVPNLPPRTGGLRFTIRRRSESRQTKKNRMRKPRVIEVSV